MKIGYVLVEFPPLTETFIRREIAALCRHGDTVVVYADSLVDDPLTLTDFDHSLTVRHVPFRNRPDDLAVAARRDGVDHLHGSLRSDSHRATRAAANTLDLPYTVTAYSGRDIFTVREPELYRAIAHDPACRAIVVEDEFMADWMVDRFGVPHDRLARVANPIDLDVYRLEGPRPARDAIVVLAIARFIRKKGLFELVEAFHRLSADRDDVVLWLVGRGPHEDDLRQAARDHPRIEFLGAMPEAQTRKVYADADIFCLPCVQTPDGNADGIPTVVLEAMAYELPIVASDLLSMPCYVRHEQEGLLVPPRDVPAIAAALDRLCTDRAMRHRLGQNGRTRVAELCDVDRNSATLRSLFGEPPVRSEFLPFGEPCLGDEEIEEVSDTLRSKWIGMGPKVARFEEEFAAYVGARYAIAVNSCTSALFLSLLASGVGPGDQVITTPFTFAATANVVEHLGATPVFADIDPVTLNLDPELVRNAITARTKAILPVHFGGLACDLDALRSIADSAGLPLVEDAAHALGARHRGRMIGGSGTLTAFSFYANKNLTTGEGGMITTDDDSLAARLRSSRLHGLTSDAWKRFTVEGHTGYEVIDLGYKANMTDLAASLGLHQLRKQETFLATRARYARCYDESFADLPVRAQHRPAEDADRHALHLYTLLLDQDRWTADRDTVVSALHAENIGATVHYRPLHTHTYYSRKYGYRPDDYPNAHRTGRCLLSLPLTPGMNETDVRQVINAVRKVAKRHTA